MVKFSDIPTMHSSDPALWSDDDCEDQGMAPTKNCTQCRTCFTPEGQPVYPALEKRGRDWCCPVCCASYGENPNPDLR